MPWWRVLLAIAMLPGTVTVIVPAWLVHSQGRVNLGWGFAPPANLLAALVGVVAIGIGVTLLATTIYLFAASGKGTLAPWDAPQKLVVRGVYRHVRNPMISGVCFVLFGEAAILGSPPILDWALIFSVANALYIPLHEEPGLKKRFGQSYLEYKQSVPRWIPLIRPWMQPETNVGPPK